MGLWLMVCVIPVRGYFYYGQFQTTRVNTCEEWIFQTSLHRSVCCPLYWVSSADLAHSLVCLNFMSSFPDGSLLTLKVVLKKPLVFKPQGFWVREPFVSFSSWWTSAQTRHYLKDYQTAGILSLFKSQVVGLGSDYLHTLNSKLGYTFHFPAVILWLLWSSKYRPPLHPLPIHMHLQVYDSRHDFLDKIKVFQALAGGTLCSWGPILSMLIVHQPP